tara:strand:+ start:1933 stop:2307 length:375 start_codon:yes stop_codon:yes gene_type:complete
MPELPRGNRAQPPFVSFERRRVSVRREVGAQACARNRLKIVTRSFHTILGSPRYSYDVLDGNSGGGSRDDVGVRRADSGATYVRIVVRWARWQLAAKVWLHGVLPVSGVQRSQRSVPEREQPSL